jgi:hypothetical protein
MKFGLSFGFNFLPFSKSPILGYALLYNFMENYKKQILQESNIPFKVDIVDFSSAKENFQKIALKDIEIWQNHLAIQSLMQNI